MSRRHTTSAAERIAAEMRAATEAGKLGELHRLMLTAAADPALAAAVWRVMAAELAGATDPAATGTEG